jgi:ribosomal protein L37E
MTQPDWYERLRDLLNGLYSEAQSAELLQTFESALAAQSDESERGALLEYWLEFFALQRFRQQKRRRRPTYDERIVPCSACGYPSSHRHHLWDVATHGENQVTLQLCANCHELFHLTYNALVRKSAYSARIARHTLHSDRLKPGVPLKILGWVLATIRYEASSGWIDGAAGSKENVERQLRWSSFVTTDANAHAAKHS